MFQWNMLNRSLLVLVICSCARLSNEVLKLPPYGIFKNLSNQATMIKTNKQTNKQTKRNKTLQISRKYACMDNFIFLK